MVGDPALVVFMKPMMNAKLLMLPIALILAACHGDAGESAIGKAFPGYHKPRAPAVKKGPTVEEQTAGMVEAVSPSKSAVPLVLKFDLLTRPVVGEALDIDLALVPQIAASGANLIVADSSGFELPGAAREIAIPAVEPEQVYRRKISVTPMSEGVQFLGLTVTVTHDEISESRAFTVPIIVSPNPKIAANDHG